ncbi:MAG: succinate dehydrogenase/fumarate reductase iron-sulfur subunit [Chlorobiales bacterium]|jgi:succinate dehydrogenase / fumarate reductase, iron-sulfur subunit|nr:succinate dehydrogenase/fumarate reductase iron-sulfur subunit [Chlorobiales bacterium]
MQDTKADIKVITFRVFRYNPQVDAHPYYDVFQIPVEKGITVLRALNYIKEHIEPRLSYRVFCQAGICGSCSMKINGLAKLACTAQVWDELTNCIDENVIVIEPINNLPPLKDMVVDMDPLVAKLEKYYGWVEPAMAEEEMGKKEFLISEEEFRIYDKATDCILCASCISDCPKLKFDEDYISPLVLLRAFRMDVDVRDSNKQKRLEKLSEIHGVLDCRLCGRCDFMCVKNIPIMDAINHLREKVVMQMIPVDKASGKK